MANKPYDKAKTVYEVSTIVGKYTDKHGNEKNRYHRFGAVIETQKGFMLKLDSIPLGEIPWNGWAFLNPPKPKPQEYQGLPEDENDSEIPF